MKNHNFELAVGPLFSIGLLFCLFAIGIFFLAKQPVCDLELTSHAEHVDIPKLGLNATNADFTLKAQVYCFASTQGLLALKTS